MMAHADSRNGAADDESTANDGTADDDTTGYQCTAGYSSRHLTNDLNPAFQQ